MANRKLRKYRPLLLLLFNRDKNRKIFKEGLGETTRNFDDNWWSVHDSKQTYSERNTKALLLQLLCKLVMRQLHKVQSQYLQTGAEDGNGNASIVTPELFVKPMYNILVYVWIWSDSDHASSLICGNKMPTRCNRWYLLQILLLVQYVSGTIMPIIRSSRVLYRWSLPMVFGAVKMENIPQVATICIILSSSWWWA